MDVFGGAPRFLAYPRPVVVQSGTDAVLKCQISGDPRPAVVWERNNEKIHPGGKYRLFEDGNVYNLIITVVTAEDSGQYICKAKNTIGETYAAATLKVEGEAQEMELREENKPRFLIKPLSTRVGRGEDAVFSCKLWGKPRPEVMWEKDGKKLNEIFESTHFSVGYQDGGWFQLKIFKTRAPDGGVYTCKARNEFGESLAGAVLLVDAGPGHEDEGNRNGYTNGHWKVNQGKQRSSRHVVARLKEDPMPTSAKVKMFAVTEGKHAKFRCYVTGKPKPEIIWRKDGRIILSGRRYLLYEDREGYFTLKVLYCKQQDNGVYVCSASNTAGQTLSAVHLFVKEPPVRFKQPLNDLEVWEQDLAILECEVPEDSVPITWYLEDRRLQPGAKYGMEEWGTKRRLTIRDMGVDDDGIYLCEMPDGGRSIAEVTVKGTIVRKLPRKVDVLEGENAAFCVEVEEEEMDIHWYKDGTELRETHQTILKSFGRTHILVFVNTTPQDSGMVVFYVGRSKTSSQLRVKVPVAKIQAPLQDALVPEGQDACFSIELSASVIGTWFWNGTQIQDDERFLIRRSRTHQSLRIRGVRDTDNGAEITFIAYGIRDSAALYIQAPLVKFTPLSEMDRNKFVEVGNPIVLYCELSDPEAQVRWYKNGVELHSVEGLHIQSEGTMRRIVIQSAEFSHSGVYSCDAIDDVIRFNVEVEAVPVWFSTIPEVEKNKCIEAGSCFELCCEVSDPTADVHWYKDETEILTDTGWDIQAEGTMRKLVVQSAEPSHSGLYSCSIPDDSVQFTVDIKAPPVKFSAFPGVVKNQLFEADYPTELHCEISDPPAKVCWYEDGVELLSKGQPHIKMEDTRRKLAVKPAQPSESGWQDSQRKDEVIQFNVQDEAEQSHSEVYKGETYDDTIQCTVDMKAESFPEIAKTNIITESLGVTEGSEVAKSKIIKESMGFYQEATIPVLAKNKAYMEGLSFTDKTLQTELTMSKILKESLSFNAVPDLNETECTRETLSFTELLEFSKNKNVKESSSFTSAPDYAKTENTKDSLSFTDASNVSKSKSLKESLSFIADPDSAKTENTKESLSFTDGSNVSKSNSLKESLSFIADSVSAKTENTQTSLSFKDRSDIANSELNKESLSLATVSKLDINENSNESLSVTDCPEFIIQESVNFTAVPEMLMKENMKETNLKQVQHSKSDSTAPFCTYKDEELPQPQCVKQETACSFQEDDRSYFKVQEICTDDDVLAFKVDHEEPTVMFSTITEAQRNISAVVGEPFKLECEVSDAAACVRWYKDGNELSFEAGVLAQSEATPVRFSALPEVARNKFIEAGCPIMLQCEISESATQVSWFKDGVPLLPETGLDIKSEGTMRALIIHSAELKHSGMYSCEAGDDHIAFRVDVAAPPVTFAYVPEEQLHRNVVEQDNLILCCEVSRSDATTQWYKDGVEIQTSNKVTMEAEHNKRTLSIKSVQMTDAGTYTCRAGGSALIFKVNVREPPVMIIYPKEDVHLDRHVPEEIVLSCELSRPNGKVTWFKDGQKLQESENIKLKTEGPYRRLKILHSRVEDSGEYVCDTADDSKFFYLSIKEPPVRFIRPRKMAYEVERFAGETIVLDCQVSRSNAEVIWKKNGEEIEENTNITITEDGSTRQLTIHSSRVEDTGQYLCDAKDDVMDFRVKINEPPLRFLQKSDIITNRHFSVSDAIVLKCELSRANSVVYWYKDNNRIVANDHFTFEEQGAFRSLIILNAEIGDTGEYMCKAKDDKIVFNVTVQEIPVYILGKATPEHYSLVAGNELILECEVSRENATVQWLCNGRVLQPDARTHIERRGTMRKLVLSNLQVSDSGEYVCDAMDDKMNVMVTVQGKLTMTTFNMTNGI
ncbi:hypothetical protein QTP70_000076 [Hemibagrus guttatus]|uniref:Ig-like domain-containing protein n=1 Tax=Hemibagrus guttatus TaxID=175788 RepID=A0AAE0R4G6_9TELE|nr:hypothetical protein QTP70_000076 [Hemibagrus guttatus]KAK3568407.1 hypothetical protein QTP86_005548 [Hemibagrus guttatus]